MVVKSLKRNHLMIVVLIAGLMNLVIGIGGFVLYYGFNIPSQLSQLENEIDSVLLLPQELVTNADKSLTSINSLLDVTTKEMNDISYNFYREAEFFWDWNILGYHPETTRNIGDTFNQLHQSVDTILISLQTMKGDITQISTTLSSLNFELNTFKSYSHAMLDFLWIITPVLYATCIFFIIQGSALVSVYLNSRSKS